VIAVVEGEAVVVEPVHGHLRRGATAAGIGNRHLERLVLEHPFASRHLDLRGFGRIGGEEMRVRESAVETAHGRAAVAGAEGGAGRVCGKRPTGARPSGAGQADGDVAHLVGVRRHEVVVEIDVVVLDHAHRRGGKGKGERWGRGEGAGAGEPGHGQGVQGSARRMARHEAVSRLRKGPKNC